MHCNVLRTLSSLSRLDSYYKSTNFRDKVVTWKVNVVLVWPQRNSVIFPIIRLCLKWPLIQPSHRDIWCTDGTYQCWTEKICHLIPCPFWETDDHLCDTLVTWSFHETHGKLDSHLHFHVLLNPYVGIQKLEIYSIK